MNERLKKIKNQKSKKRDNNFFVGPDLYVHFNYMDESFVEIWITRDSYRESHMAAIILAAGRSEKELFEQMDDWVKDDILKIANRYLTDAGEHIVREGDGYAFEYH